MKRNWILSLILALALCLSGYVDAKHLRLRPMSASEVYRVLREAGREDVIPQGRIITQGIAAASGLALALKKGIGGALVYDLVTSNATQEYLNNLNLSQMLSGYNFTGLTNGLTNSFVLPTWNFSLPQFNFALPCNWNRWNISGLNFRNCGTVNTIQYSTQEICFNSRSINDLGSGDDGANEDYDYENVEALGRQTSPTVTTTGNLVTSPTNTATLTDTTTQTGNSDTVNCIVIQKPVKRYRRHRRSTSSRIKAILEKN